MNNSFFVRCCQAACDLQRIVKRFSLRQCGACHTITQRFAFKKFRDNVGRAIVNADVMDD